MLEWILITILSALVTYLQIKLVDTQTKLTDIEMRYRWAQNTLDAIADEKERQ